MKRFSKKVNIHGESFEIEVVFENEGKLPWKFSIRNSAKCYFSEINRNKYTIITKNLKSETLESKRILSTILQRIESSDFNCYFALSNRSLLNELVSKNSKSNGKYLVLQFCLNNDKNNVSEDINQPMTKSKLWIVLSEVHINRDENIININEDDQKMDFPPKLSFKSKKSEPRVKNFGGQEISKSNSKSNNKTCFVNGINKLRRLSENNKLVIQQGIETLNEDFKVDPIHKIEKKRSGRKYRYFVDKVLEDYEKISNVINKLQQDNMRIRDIILEKKTFQEEYNDKEDEEEVWSNENPDNSFEEEEIVFQFLNSSQRSINRE